MTHSHCLLCFVPCDECPNKLESRKMTDTTLLPCPFCGCTDIWIEDTMGVWSIECNGPDCSASTNRGYGKREFAIAAWNRRDQWPALNDDLREILGMMCFQAGPIAHAFQRAGRDIPAKAEAEQAFVIHWLVGLYLKHGSEWRKHASDEITAITPPAPVSGGNK